MLDTCLSPVARVFLLHATRGVQRRVETLLSSEAAARFLLFRSPPPASVRYFLPSAAEEDLVVLVVVVSFSSLLLPLVSRIYIYSRAVVDPSVAVSHRLDFRAEFSLSVLEFIPRRCKTNGPLSARTTASTKYVARSRLELKSPGLVNQRGYTSRGHLFRTAAIDLAPSALQFRFVYPSLTESDIRDRLCARTFHLHLKTSARKADSILLHTHTHNVTTVCGRTKGNDNEII